MESPQEAIPLKDSLEVISLNDLLKRIEALEKLTGHHTTNIANNKEEVHRAHGRITQYHSPDKSTET